MASSITIERSGRADRALMTAIHDTLRRDLDELLHTTAGPAAARARWIVFRDQQASARLGAVRDLARELERPGIRARRR